MGLTDPLARPLGPTPEAQSETDWAALLGPVARQLRGDPTREGGEDWRFGARGSLVVHVAGDRAGTWHSFETGDSGGVLDLVEWRLQTDRAGAVRWMVEQGYLVDRGGQAVIPAVGQTEPKPVKSSLPSMEHPKSTTQAAPEDASALWAMTLPADDTPARAYLAARGTWPPSSVEGAPDLPKDVRWLPAASLRTWSRAVPDGRSQYWLPAAAVGAIAFAYRNAAGEGVAMQLEALTAEGTRRTPWKDRRGTVIERWRRCVAEKRGAWFAPQALRDGRLLLVEGEADALAVALTGWNGEIRAVGGAEGLQAASCAELETPRPVVVLPDDDEAGHKGALRLIEQLYPRPCRSHRLAPGSDPADMLASALCEVAERLEAAPGQGPDDARQQAWARLLDAVDRGAFRIAPALDDPSPETPDDPSPNGGGPGADSECNCADWQRRTAGMAAHSEDEVAALALPLPWQDKGGGLLAAAECCSHGSSRPRRRTALSGS